MAILFSYIFYFIAATASPIQRRWLATRKNSENTGQISLAFKVSLIAALFSLLLPLFQPFYIHGSIFRIVLLAIVSGVVGSFVYITSYLAQKHVEAGVASLVGNIYTPVTIILATVFLNEKLTYLQILGTIISFIGIVIVSKKHRIGRFHFDKYFLMQVASGVFLAFVLISERALIKTTGFTAGTMISWFAQFISLGIIVLITRNKDTYSNKDIAITGTLRFLQSLSWVVLCTVVGNLSVVSSITTFKVVLVFIIGALFLKEKEELPRKIFGCFVTIAGLLLVQ